MNIILTALSKIIISRKIIQVNYEGNFTGKLYFSLILITEHFRKYYHVKKSKKITLIEKLIEKFAIPFAIGYSIAFSVEPITLGFTLILMSIFFYDIFKFFIRVILR